MDSTEKQQPTKVDEEISELMSLLHGASQVVGLQVSFSIMLESLLQFAINDKILVEPDNREEHGLLLCDIIKGLIEQHNKRLDAHLEKVGMTREEFINKKFGPQAGETIQ